MAKIYEIKQAQQANELNQLKMQETQRGMAENEAVKNYMAQAVARGEDLSSPDFVRGLYGISPTQGSALEKSRVELAKDRALTKSTELDQITKIHGLIKTGAKQVLTNPTLANAISITQNIGRMTNSDVSADIAQLNAIGDNPEGIRKWAASHALEAEKLLPKLERVDIGGAINYTNFDPITGLPTVVGSTAKTATPGDVMSATTTRRGQDLTNTRELQRIEIEKGKNSPEAIAMRAKMTEQGKAEAKFEAAAPEAMSKAAEAIRKLDEMVGTEPIRTKEG
jgi:hypothetical protein